MFSSFLLALKETAASDDEDEARSSRRRRKKLGKMCAAEEAGPGRNYQAERGDTFYKQREKKTRASSQSDTQHSSMHVTLK
jgi:hypothetical protein